MSETGRPSVPAADAGDGSRAAVLEDRDEILALAEESAGLGIWYVDLRTRMIRGTPYYFRMMGVEPAGDTVPLSTMVAIRHPEDSERVRRTYLAALEDGTDRAEVQFRILHRDMRIRWIHGRGQVIRDAAGQAIRMAGVNVDVTDSKRGEAALRESEARFRRVFEQSPLGKATAGADLKLREVNPALCRMIGCRPADLIGRSFLEMVHPDDRPRCAEAATALGTGAAAQIQMEERFLRRTGEPFWVRVNVAPIRDVDGNILYSLGIIEDIDERTRMTQALQDSERRLRELNERLEDLAEERARLLASSRAQMQAFFDNSPDWLTLIRAMPDGRFVYVDVNPATEIAYGRPRDAIVGRTVDDILGVDQAQIPLQMLRACIETGAPQRYVAHRSLAGRTTTIDVMFIAVPRHDEATDRLIITTARDLTEREQLEAQLRQAQKMEAIGKLTGGVAHDFNNLLAVIAGNAELARRAPDARIARMLDNILRASERGVALTRQLLSFSRRQSANPQVLDLRTELPRVSEMLRASLRGDIHLSTVVAEDLWPIEADLGELEIALLNMAANARDAMPGGGTFSVEASNQPARGTEQDHVLIRVSDTGLGIPAAVLNRVFDPFFTTKPPGEGTGLGLSQVYGFVQQSGGSVSIESTTGVGTRLTLRLPRAAKPLASPGVTDQAVPLPDGGGRVLLVEDNPEVASVTAQMLHAMGLTVELADRAHKALARLEAGQDFDLLLTDVVMPGGMNGLDLARAVAQRFADLPVILVSGYNDVAETDDDRFTILRKPVPFQELSRCIAACLDRAATRPQPAGAL